MIQYKVLTPEREPDIEDALNREAAAGWTFVALVPMIFPPDAQSTHGECTHTYAAVMQRER